MELICDVIVRDRRTGLVVNEARNFASTKTIELNANGDAIYRFNFEFSTVVDKRLVDQIDRRGKRE